MFCSNVTSVCRSQALMIEGRPRVRSDPLLIRALQSSLTRDDPASWELLTQPCLNNFDHISRCYHHWAM